MPFQSDAGNEPHVALFRDRLMDTSRAMFLWDRFVGITSERSDAMVGRQAWPKEILSSESPILIIPQGDGKFRNAAGRVGTNRHVLGTVTEYNTEGVAGDATAINTGEMDELNYTELFWHRRRLVKPVRQGRYNEELGGSWMLQLVAQSGPKLMELLMRVKSMDIFHAMYYGHARHIIYDSNIGVGMTTDAALGGLGESIRMHENFCIPGLAEGTSANNTRYCTWSSTHATYMQSLSRNLALMTAENRFKCGMTWLGIVEQELLSKLKVGRMNPKAGQPEFWLTVTNAQWMQLKNDPLLRDQIIMDNPKAIDHSELFFGNASFRWGGMRIFRGGYRGPTRVYCYQSGDTLSTTNGPGLNTTSANATRVVFGFVDNDFTPRDMVDSGVIGSETSDDSSQPWLSRDVAIGGAYKPMILGLDIWKPEFLREMEDFENVKQMAIDAAYGFSRKPRYNKTTPASATTAVNDTSVLFVSYSPNLIVA